MLLEVDHPRAGRIKTIGFPVKMGRTPCAVSLPPPCLGQHTDEILNQLGYAQADIDRLRRDGVV